MIRFFISLALIFSALALAPMVLTEPGYISVALHGSIYELTVYTAVFWFVVIVTSLFLLLRLIRTSFTLTFSSWNKIMFVNVNRANRIFDQGVAAYVLQDYAKAESLLVKCADTIGASKVAYLLAASAAEKQHSIENAQNYIAEIEQISAANPVKNSKGDDTLLVGLQLLLSFKEAHKARDLLNQHTKAIPHSAPLLKLAIELCLLEKNYLQVIEYLTLARKEKTFTESMVSLWEQTAYTTLFSQQATLYDQKTLVEFWQQQPRKIKQREAVIFSYCHVLINHQILTPLEDLLLPPLKKDASESFLLRLQHLILQLPHDKHAHKMSSLISAIKKHLHKNSHSPKWLSTLGHVALFNGEWEMAEKSFNSLIALPNKQYSDNDIKSYATALSQQNKHADANKWLMTLCSS
jgi:HemY protein